MTSHQQNEFLHVTRRESYRWFLPINTRWMDNDVYGHVNNVHYYSYFDTIVNTFLIQQCGLDIHHGDVIGYIVHSECNYKQAVAFPDQLEGALNVKKIGNSSVQYGLAVFKLGESNAAAYGQFTHVFVSRKNERPLTIPVWIRTELEKIQR